MIAIWSYIIAAAILCGLSILVARYFSLWIQAYFTGTRISFLDLVLMSLRKANPRAIVQCKVMAVQSGLAELSTSAIEAQYLAGGDVHRVTLALIAADRARICLDWDTAAAIDLAGRDIMEAVRVSVNPKVINCPDPNDGGGDTLYGVARDGIQLKVRVRVTVRTNLSQLVGGATEATVVARVGQGIISAIGSCDSYRDALGDPMVITRKVDSERAGLSNCLRHCLNRHCRYRRGDEYRRQTADRSGRRRCPSCPRRRPKSGGPWRLPGSRR